MSNHYQEDDLRQNQDLLSAIGRVAMASAEVDQTLTSVLDEVADRGDHTWILFRGQTTDWLLKSITEVLNFGGTPFRSTPEDIEQVRRSIETLSRLHSFRNIVIHGTWSTTPVYSEIDDDDPDYRPRPRPWGKKDGDPILYCHRTRLRKVPPDQEFTITDVEHLAFQIEQIDSELLALLRKWNDRALAETSHFEPKASEIETG